ncbi:MAG: dihydroorotase [Pirellulaceae bacterium]
MQEITITKPDDWHLHVRDGELLKLVVPHTARQFGRAIIMPNLVPPITTTRLAGQYRERIRAAVPTDCDFQPLMTLYLHEDMPASEVSLARSSGFVHAIKWYPSGATTNSHHGVRDISRCFDVLEAMQTHGLRLLVHSETTDPSVDTFDREAVFIERDLAPVIARFPNLKVVVEHATTRQAVQFVREASDNVAATLTAHHLLLNRTAMFTGGLRPHLYCLPILKREEHRLALVEAATSGNRKFFLGTDSAPHPRHAKESACGCAGVYTAHAAIELYAELFDQVGALDRLEGFASFHGPDFYGLPRNQAQIRLLKVEWSVPPTFSFSDSELMPFRSGETVGWKVDG